MLSYQLQVLAVGTGTIVTSYQKSFLVNWDLFGLSRFLDRAGAGGQAGQEAGESEERVWSWSHLVLGQ